MSVCVNIINYKHINHVATVKYYIRDGKNGATIYVHFNISTAQKFRTTTGLYINPKEWNNKKGMPKNTFATSKKIIITLQALERAILDKFNEITANGQTFDKDFLKVVVNNFFNKDKPSNRYFVEFIQKYIDTAPTRKNNKGGFGLSDNRIKRIEAFKKTFKQYEKEILKDALTIEEMTNDTLINFRDYLLSFGYSKNFVGGNLATFKCICNFIKDKNINIDVRTERIEQIREYKDPENVITLSFEELEKIKNIEILYPPYLNNVRKWLLLGCEIGQRGRDLLNLTEKNLLEIEGVPAFRVKQQKTNKEVYIPLTPRARDIIKDGLPYKISLEAFNEYLKELCRKSGINTIVKNRLPRTNSTPSQLVEVEKWEAVSSHICRRSFATNYYGKIPTSTLKTITGHSTEEMFLKYIGKTAFNHAKEMIQAFKLLTE